MLDYIPFARCRICNRKLTISISSISIYSKKEKRKLGHFRRDYFLLVYLIWSLWIVKMKVQTLTSWVQGLATSQMNDCHAWKITSKLSVLPFWIFLSSHLAIKRNWSCFQYSIFIFLPHFAWRQRFSSNIGYF